MSEHESLRARVECELGELVARGATRDELVAALEAALACRLWVLSGDDAVNEQAIGYPIVPGTEVLGWLQSDVPVALATAELADCLVYAGRIIGIELIRERAALETRWSFEADLLTELVEAGDTIPERLEQRAQHASFDLSSRWHVLLLAIDDSSASSEMLAAARRPALASERSMICELGERLAVAVCEEPAEGREAKLRYLHRVARGLGVDMRVGVSSAVTDFACGVRQAEAALRLATCGPPTSTMFHEDLGSLRFLLNAPNQVELMSLVSTHIGPLAEHDRERQGELLDTLRVYLHEGGNRRRAAERCNVHQSTIKYRLHRIRELLGCDLTDANVRFDLMLSLKILDLLRPVHADPITRRILQPA
jgi:hypothetical protein